MSIQDITIVITSFKSDEKINDCLNSINRECKVLLIENSNDTEFKRRIEKKFTNVECILTGENLGYGAANNIGLKVVPAALPGPGLLERGWGGVSAPAYREDWRAFSY